MPRHPHQRCVVQAPVLHELAGQFHGIPFHVADPRSLGLVHRGEHVLQTMAEFMEEGFDLFEAHQAWRVSDRWGLVADQVGDGKDKRAIAQPTTAQAFIHPGTTSLGSRATEGIEIERCDGLTTCCIDPEEANVLMPDRRLSIGGADVHLEEALAQAEQPIQHLGQWEPGSQRFLVQIKTLLAEFLRPERQVPWGQISGFMRTVSLGAGPEICQLLLGCGIGSSAQFLEQCLDCGNVIGHLAGQTEVSPMGVSQPLGLFPPQREDLLDQSPVVEITGGSPADMSLVDRFPELPIGRMGQEGQITGHVQPQ